MGNNMEAPELHRHDGDTSILLYTLKQDGWRKGQPVMVNDVMIRIENANGSQNDLGAIAERIRADLAAPAPAEVEGLVKRLRVKGRQGREQANHHIRRMEVERIEAATALTERQAEIERLRKDRDALDRKWTIAVQLAAHAHNTEGDPGVLIDAANARAEKAEVEHDAWKVNAGSLAMQLRGFSSEYDWSDEDTAALAAYEKLKGEV